MFNHVPINWFQTIENSNIVLFIPVSAINPNWGFWWLNDKTNRDSNKFAPSMYAVILQTGEARILRA
jgi:hypothetical protein